MTEFESNKTPDKKQPHLFVFKEDTWKYFEELGRKNNISPLDVAKKILGLGMGIAKIEELEYGEIIWRKKDKTEIHIRLFSNGKKGL